MQRDFNRSSLEGVYRMLFELAKGNLSHQIRRSHHRDELEGLIALMNLTAKKLNKNRNQFLWFNRQNEVVVIRTASFLLDESMKIVDYHLPDGQFNTLHTKRNIRGKAFALLLVEEFHPKWEKLIQELKNKNQRFTLVHLPYKTYSLSYLAVHSLVTRVITKKVSSFVVYSSLLDIEKDEHYNIRQHAPRNTISIWDQQLFKKVNEYIMDHLKEPLIPVFDIASLYNTNEHKIKTGFKKIYGLTPYQYHRKERIKSSTILIENTDISLTEIAHRMGFQSYKTFSRAFKAVMKITPMKYREIYRKTYT